MTTTPTAPDLWARIGPYRMSWSDFGELASGLAEVIRRDGFRPAVLCVVVRGGLQVGSFLASTLDVWRLHLVRVRRTVGDDLYAPKREAQLEVLPSHPLGGAEDVLVVDDIAGSGATAVLVDRYVRRHTTGEVRMAALAYNPRGSYRPSYHAVRVDDWVVFPWDAQRSPLPGERPLPGPGRR